MQVLQQAKESVAALLPRRSVLRVEPGALLFRHVRLRLTLWYSAVLGCALLLFCITFYFGMMRLLYAPIEQSISHEALAIADLWHHYPTMNCNPPSSMSEPSISPDARKIFSDANIFSYVVCYDPQGKVLHALSIDLPTKFLSSNLVVFKVAQSRQIQSGVVDGGGSVGRIYSYAVPVFDAQNQHVIGIILVGRPLAEIDHALHAIVSFLIIVGIIILLSASLGGLFLANRALQPTREAFSRQQRFIADASHELRTPLTFLCANTEILLDEREHFSPDDVNLLEDIYTEANHMNALATNMLALARLDADESHQHYEHDIVNLSALAERIGRQGQALARKKGITIQVENKGPVMVIGDPVLLEQAALVLVDNALKYNRADGRITISTYIDQGIAYLTVQDTGIGMTEESLSHLGERFYRVDKARSRAVGGTGLGLSIAHGIARAHKGTLQLSSELNVGTKATFSLPALRESSGEGFDIRALHRQSLV